LKANKRFLGTATLLTLFLTVLPALSQTGQPLPDAPAPDSGPTPVHASDTEDPYAPSKWFGVVDPGEKVPALNPRDKMMFWLHEEVSPAGWFPTFWSAGWDQLWNSDPKYGSDSAAFGERLGAAALRESSYRFFSDSLLPTLTHEDPRYFRKAYGSVTSRGVYAAEQVFVCPRDNGSTGFNYSDVLGHAGGAALAMTYYPAPSVNARVAAETFGWSLVGDASGNLFFEFWPDVRDAVFHHHKHKTASP
jgi:hypothetical protein